MSDTWQITEGVNNDYPQPINCVSPPDIPNTNIHMWRITEGVNGGYPYTGVMPQMPHLGAFANAKKLKYVRIPPSVKRIGEYSFINTQLKSVTIAKDCVYSNTSFPEGCIINFYP